AAADPVPGRERSRARHRSRPGVDAAVPVASSCRSRPGVQFVARDRDRCLHHAL
ncbi:MAG: hypothetical protein AVDCRST_MAG87-527, partial [uncultured Thermomicrobiales bacterium]